MINVDKYTENKVTEQDLENIFTSDIRQKADTFLKRLEQEQSDKVLSDFFDDPDFNVIMGYWADNDQDELFLYIEKEAYDYALETDRHFLNFDWEIKKGLTFSNYYFYKHYNELYKYNGDSLYPTITFSGYLMSIISYNSAKRWDVGFLPFNNRMRLDFYQNK